MNISQLNRILKEIQKNHFMDGRAIKYTNIDWDSRTQSFWKIEFRHWFKEKRTRFTNTNRPIEQRRDLYEEIMEWLKEGK